MDVNGQLQAPAPLFRGKESAVSIGQEVVWALLSAGHCGELRSLALLGIEPEPSSPYSIAVKTEAFQTKEISNVLARRFQSNVENVYEF
jgi:hypothetical protein